MVGIGGIMEWISVKDRLPLDPSDGPDQVGVIVATRFKDVFYTEFKCGNSLERDLPWHKFKDCGDDGYVTHWMPLPAPPRSDQPEVK